MNKHLIGVDPPADPSPALAIAAGVLAFVAFALVMVGVLAPPWAARAALLSGLLVGGALIALVAGTRRALRDRDAAYAQLAARMALGAENLATLIDSIGDAHIETDAQGRVVQMDETAARLTGISPTQARGRPVGEVLHLVDPDTGAAVEPTASTVLREGRVVGVDVRGALGRESGPPFPIEHCAAPILSPDGQVTGVTVVFHDLSSELDASAGEAWTMELAMENRRVQETNRARTDYMVGISHEIRTLINGVVGFAEVLFYGEADTTPAEQHEYLGDIIGNARRLWQLISDVVDYSEVQTGKITAAAEPLDLQGVLREILEPMLPTAASRRIQLEGEVDPALPYVVLDPLRFRQLLYNYVSNALRAAPDGGTVRVKILPEGADQFRVDVSDTGRGIPAADLPHVFEAFFPGSDGTNRRRDDTGMGLTIIRRIVEAMDGRVSASSEPGQGSTLTAILPRRPIASGAELAASGPAGDIARGRRILVVDDNAVNLKLIRILLAVEGYAVQAALDAPAAMASIEAQLPELILMDLQLPGVSGLDLTRRLRASPKTAHIPIIAVTSFAMPGAEEQAIAAGCTGFITKPIDTRTFHAVVAQHLPTLSGP